MKLKPNYIEGIFNYCDRWCERCEFTSRCNVFEDTSGLTPEEQDINNQKFWETLTSIMAETKAMIEKAAADRGIDLQAAMAELGDDFEANQKQQRNKSREHPLGKLSYQYAQDVHTWIAANHTLDTARQHWLHSAMLGLAPAEEIESNIALIEEALTVIQWYQHFIHVKLMRALMSGQRNLNVDEFEEFSNGSDGSAKIALISIERSMQAWAVMLKLFPGVEDDVLPKLGLLQKLLRLTEEHFPDARAFQRPGFDFMPPAES